MGVAGPVVFTLLWIVLGDAHSGYSQRTETISALAAVGAPGRWLMLAGFGLLAVSLAVTALGAAAPGDPSLGDPSLGDPSLGGTVSRRYGSLAPAFVGVAALGVLLAAVAPTSCSNAAWCRPVSYSGVGGWHALGAGLMFAGLPLAMLAVAWVSRRWRSLRTSGFSRRGFSRRGFSRPGFRAAGFRAAPGVRAAGFRAAPAGSTGGSRSSRSWWPYRCCCGSSAIRGRGVASPRRRT